MTETELEIVEGVEAVTLNQEEPLENDVVDPWNVASSSDSGIDYEKLIRK